jgi:hypothetical protein
MRAMSGESRTTAATQDARGARLWLPIAILGSARFVMVLDGSVIKVSISQIVADLDTTIQGVHRRLRLRRWLWRR